MILRNFRVSLFIFSKKIILHSSLNQLYVTIVLRYKSTCDVNGSPNCVLSPTPKKKKNRLAIFPPPRLRLRLRLQLGRLTQVFLLIHPPSFVDDPPQSSLTLYSNSYLKIKGSMYVYSFFFFF